MSARGCERHTPLYAGVINVRVNWEPVGYIDVWQCTKCGKLFAEERRLGMKESDLTIGFKEPRGVLVVLVVKEGGRYKWLLVDAVPGERIRLDRIGLGDCSLVFSEGLRLEPGVKCPKMAVARVEDVLNTNLELTKLV